MIFDKILLWLIKRLVFIWDRKNDKTVLDFAKDEYVGYVIMVERHYKDYFTLGTKKVYYPSIGLISRENQNDS